MASAFARRVAEFGSAVLEPHQFDRVAPLVFERPSAGLVQGIEFVLGTGALKGRFTVNLYWRYCHNPLAKDDSMDYWQRLGVFLSGRDEWFDAGGAGLESTFAWLRETFAEKVLPFFARYQSIGAIVQAYEAGQIGDSTAFGVDPGWREYNLGFAYLQLGDRAKAVNHLQRVIDEHSDMPHAWVQERRGSAEAALTEARQGP